MVVGQALPAAHAVVAGRTSAGSRAVAVAAVVVVVVVVDRYRIGKGAVVADRTVAVGHIVVAGQTVAAVEIAVATRPGLVATYLACCSGLSYGTLTHPPSHRSVLSRGL